VDKLINRVRATAYYLDKSNQLRRTIANYNSTVLLDSVKCPQDLSLLMKADRDADSGDIINYRLTAENHLDENLSVNLTAILSPGAQFLDSSQKPGESGEDNVTWSFRLAPAKRKIITYKVRVSGSGLIRGMAEASATSKESGRSLASDSSASVLIPKPSVLTDTQIIDDWLAGSLSTTGADACGSISGKCLLLPNETLNLYKIPIRLVPGSQGYREELSCC
jgi:hypothetical protein